MKVKLVHLLERVQDIKCPTESSTGLQQDLVEAINSAMVIYDCFPEDSFVKLDLAMVALCALVKYQNCKTTQ